MIDAHGLNGGQMVAVPTSAVPIVFSGGEMDYYTASADQDDQIQTVALDPAQRHRFRATPGFEVHLVPRRILRRSTPVPVLDSDVTVVTVISND